MFLVPVPERWDPAPHGWHPVDVETPPGGIYLRKKVPTAKSPASLAIFRNPVTGQLVAWYGPATKKPVKVSRGELLAEIGIAQSDFGSVDARKEGWGRDVVSANTSD